MISSSSSKNHLYDHIITLDNPNHPHHNHHHNHDKVSPSSPSSYSRSPDKKKRKEWSFEVDPQRRFQLMQSTLIICNVIALFCGVAGLIAAGFVGPRPAFSIFQIGGQLGLVSVYTIIASLCGLYGARRESVPLLLIYGVMILIALFSRSVVYFIVSLVTPSSAAAISLSMITAFLEVILILFSFGLAADIRNRKLQTAESEITKTSTCSPSPEHYATVP